MWLLRFYKKLNYLFLFVFPFLLVVSILFILLNENSVSIIFSLLLPLLLTINILQFVWCLLKKNRKVLFNLLPLLFFFFFFDSFVQFNFKEKHENDGISLMTYNVAGNFKEGSEKYKAIHNKIMQFIETEHPDVLVMQEFWNFGLKYLKKSYPYYFLGYRSKVDKSLQVILSRYPIKNMGYVDFSNTRNNAMYADIDVNGKIVRIYNVHLESYKLDSKHQLRNLNSYRFVIPTVFQTEIIRIAQAKLVREHINSFDGDVIVVGDFNSTQYSPVYRILKDTKKDSFVEAGNGFGSTFELFNYPFKLDHILVDESFEVINHQNFDINLSDHEPVLAEIKFKD